MKKRSSRNARSRPVPPELFSQALKDDRCGYCGRRMAKEESTKEHLIPTSVTGSRPYDFMACRPCNNEKGALDEVIAWIMKLGVINSEKLERFDSTEVSLEGKKSLIAFLKELDPPFKRGGEDWYAVSPSWRIIETLREWTKWFARGLYFLETGKILKHEEGTRYPERMILPEFLGAMAMKSLANEGPEGVNPDGIFRPPPNVPRWGDVWLLGRSIKHREGIRLCLDGKYVFSATVSGYSKRRLLESMNKQIQLHPDPVIRALANKLCAENSELTDIRKTRGKKRGILNTE